MSTFPLIVPHCTGYPLFLELILNILLLVLESLVGLASFYFNDMVIPFSSAS